MPPGHASMIKGQHGLGQQERANRGCRARTVSCVGWGSAERGSKTTRPCPGCVSLGRKALCVVRQLGHLPGVSASAHSRWELEEVGWMSHLNGKHQFWAWLSSGCQVEGSAALMGWEQVQMLVEWGDSGQLGPTSVEAHTSSTLLLSSMVRATKTLPHSSFKKIYIYIYIYFIYLFLAVFGLSCIKWDLLLLSTGFSLVMVHGLQSAWAQ